jgi:hypothetical protein
MRFRRSKLFFRPRNRNCEYADRVLDNLRQFLGADNHEEGDAARGYRSVHGQSFLRHWSQDTATSGSSCSHCSPLNAATTNDHMLTQKYVVGDIKTEELRMVSAPAALADLPPTTPGRRPVIGVALEAGGALVLAHIGVLKWMEEHHIPVDRISGTSKGRLVSALHASGNVRRLMSSSLIFVCQA